MEKIKAAKWCWEQGIRIYPVPVPRSNGKQKPECYIEIDFGSKKQKGEMTYKQDSKLYDKIHELYAYYFSKRNG